MLYTSIIVLSHNAIWRHLVALLSELQVRADPTLGQMELSRTFCFLTLFAKEFHMEMLLECFCMYSNTSSNLIEIICNTEKEP